MKSHSIDTNWPVVVGGGEWVEVSEVVCVCAKGKLYKLVNYTASDRLCVHLWGRWGWRVVQQQQQQQQSGQWPLRGGRRNDVDDNPMKWSPLPTAPLNGLLLSVLISSAYHGTTTRHQLLCLPSPLVMNEIRKNDEKMLWKRTVCWLTGAFAL